MGLPTSPWLDQSAPAQWRIGSPETAAASVPLDTPTAMNPQSNNHSVDTTLTWKMAGTIVIALVVIFGMKASGFRFVTSASVGIGK